MHGKTEKGRSGKKETEVQGVAEKGGRRRKDARTQEWRQCRHIPNQGREEGRTRGRRGKDKGVARDSGRGEDAGGRESKGEEERRGRAGDSGRVDS